jgi:hypothetical protein
MSDEISKPAGTSAEVLVRLLDASGALLVSDRSEELALPDDELHNEILRPLLPAMLADAALREFWLGQETRGFLGRLAAHLRGEGARPKWEAGDFEIHVTASYRAGADARALADTLLSEESLRGLTADLMNRVLEMVWKELPAGARAAAAAAAMGTGLVEGFKRIDLEATREEESARVLITWRAWARWPKWKRDAWWRKHGATVQSGKKLRPLGWLIQTGR